MRHVHIELEKLLPDCSGGVRWVSSGRGPLGIGHGGRGGAIHGILVLNILFNLVSKQKKNI